MTTPYCTRDQWAKRKSSKTQSYDDWADYADAEDYPDVHSLSEALDDATDIMNDSDHIGCLTTNITDTDYTDRLERICYNMASRILGVEGNQAMQGGIWTYSPGDMLNRYERNFLNNVGIAKGYKLGMGVGSG